MTTRVFNLTDAERRRIEHIDRLVARGGESVAELLTSTGDPSWTVRRAVVAALGALGDEAVAALCAWLRDQRTTEHAIAATVDALVASRGQTATTEVMSLLEDRRPAVAADAAHILGRRRALEAVPVLATALEHRDDNVAVAAIEALGAIGGNGAVDALIGVLLSQSFFRTFPAIQVLARTADPRVVAPLAALLDDETYRFEAARALGRTGYAQAIGPLTSLLPRAPDATVRLVALALADLLARAEWNGSIEHVVETLRLVSRAALPRFVAASRTATPEERTAIATVLGHVGDASVLPALSRLLDDVEARDVATDAIQRLTRVHEDALLGGLGSADAATRAAVLPIVNTMRAAELVRALLADDDAETRARACEALARIGDTSAVPALFAALADGNLRVAHAAIGAIQSLGVEDTGSRAIAALRTGEAAVRRHALRIIAYMGFADSFDAVLEAVADPDPRMVQLAVAALGPSTDPRVDATLAKLARDPHEPVRSAAMRVAPHRTLEIALQLLERGLEDEAAWVRYYACQALGRLGAPVATPLVVGRLSDATPHVRIAAIEALGHLDTAAAWQALSSAIRSEDPDERRAALGSMALRPHDQALPYLLSGSVSDDVATRLIALSGLVRRPEPAALEA
nr:HEAT repeat domain-containing protein [Myxococcota bacterium]